MPDPSNIVPQIPALANIQDPNVRMALQAMQQNWEVRNGNTANQGSRFVTANEIGNLTQQELQKLLGVAKGVPGLSSDNVVGSQAGALIDNLANAVAQSYLFQRLGQRIPLLSIPDKVFGAVGQAEAVNAERYRQSVEADSATNERVTTMGTAVANAQAAISNESTTRAQKDMAIASSLARIWASIGGSPPSNDFSALIQDSQMAAATPAAAQATKYTTLQSAVFDPGTGANNIATLQASFSTYVSNVDGKMNTLYTIQTQLSTGGQTVVGGFGLAGTVGGGVGPTIDFGVRADKFFIAATSSTPDGATQIAQGSTIPFMVITSTQTIGGITYNPGVYIKNAVIANAAIGTANIQAAAITTALIASAAVGTAQIANAAITNAQIANAAVGTLSIQGDAVTVPRQSSGSGSSVGFGNQVVCSVFVPSGVGSVACFGGVNLSGSQSLGGGGGTVWLARDGTQFGGSLSLTPIPQGITSQYSSGVWLAIDTSGVGGNYQLVVQSSQTTWSGNIVAIGCKR